MAIFDKFQHLVEARQELAESGVDSINVVMEEIISPTEAMVNGRHTILAGTNNYLGLTFDPDCIDAACKAVHDQGTGTTGSRMANGTYASHVALEHDLADFFGCRGTIVFSTGYVANLGVLAALAGPGDVILLDGDCHASIYDGCRLGGADVIRFRHNDVNDLEKRLKRLGERTENALILVEGIYSMLGDRAPLADIAAVKNKYGAYLLVDEAHSLGVLGEQGRGLASNHPELELIRYASRPYIFTASPSPSIIASTRAALAALRARPELRKRLWDNARRLYQRLQEMGFVLGPEPSPIVAIRLENKAEALSLWTGLLEHGVYVNMVLPPATPDNSPLLRCSMSAGHSPEQVEQICEAFEALRNVALSSQTA
jgi:8-amino-7-oxononanoate synthase